MNTRSLSMSLVALTTVSVLSACSVDDAPAPSGAGAAPSAAGSADPAAPGGATASADPAAPAASGQAVIDTDAVLEIEDQVSKGPTVNVKAAAVTTGGWVVVASDGGRNVLGAGMVPPGASPTLVQVSLAEIITEDTELVARLYDDSNADGLYGAGDKPVSNDDADDDDDAKAFAGELETFTFRGADVINS